MSINGEAVTTEQTQPVFNPATRSIFAQVPDASKEQLDQTVDAAHRALKMWSATPADERQAALETYADLIESHAEELMSLLTAEQGKPRAGSEWEVLGSVAWLRAVASQRLPDEVVEETEDRRVVTRYTPVGVVGAIVPWNFPISMIARSLACSFAAGNSTVIKPAELTPLATTSFFAQAIHNAEVPKGLINIVTGYGSEAGAALTAHPDVAQITFTGSVKTGKAILHAAAERAVPAVVELGGKSAAVVLPDADIDKVVNATKVGIFSQAGQICSAMSRMIVHKSIKDEVLEKLSKLAASIKVGPGDEEGVDLTPVISEEQLQKVENYARSGLQAGAKAVSGGNRVDRKGFFFEPTIYSDVKPDMTIAQEEIFGPFLSVLDYEDHEEAIHIANDTDYGLAAGVFTKDVDMATKTASRLNGGQVYVNSWFTGSIATPFGGYKQSGYSREKGQQAIKSYLQLKNVGIQL